jgi:hypothetical protein
MYRMTDSVDGVTKDRRETEATSIFGAPIEVSDNSDRQLSCYELQEAMWLVAFGGVFRAYFGAQPINIFANWNAYQYVRDSTEGQYHLAREQVARSIFAGRGLLPTQVSPFRR